MNTHLRSVPVACPVSWACEGCGRPESVGGGELGVWEVHTRHGCYCVTLCGCCAASGRPPRLRAAQAALRVIEHAAHYRTHQHRKEFIR